MKNTKTILAKDLKPEYYYRDSLYFLFFINNISTINGVCDVSYYRWDKYLKEWEFKSCKVTEDSIFTMTADFKDWDTFFQYILKENIPAVPGYFAIPSGKGYHCFSSENEPGFTIEEGAITKRVIPENKNSKTCVQCFKPNKEVPLLLFSTFYCPACEP